MVGTIFAMKRRTPQILEPFDAAICHDDGQGLGVGDTLDVALCGEVLQPGLTMISADAVVPPGFRMTATSTPGLSIELHTLGRSRTVGLSHTRAIELRESVAGVIHTDQPETWRTYGTVGQRISVYSLFATRDWFNHNDPLLHDCGFSMPPHLSIHEMSLPPQLVLAAAAAPKCGYRGGLYTLHNEGVALQVLTHVLSLSAGPESRSSTALADRRRKRRAENARDYLFDRLDEDLSLGEIAKALAVSPRRLQRDFQAVFGTTPFAWVREQRLRRAAAKLAAGEVSVTEAAFDAGYSGTSGFNRAARAILGLSPMDLIRR